MFCIPQWGCLYLYVGLDTWFQATVFYIVGLCHGVCKRPAIGQYRSSCPTASAACFRANQYKIREIPYHSCKVIRRTVSLAARKHDNSDTIGYYPSPTRSLWNEIGKITVPATNFMPIVPDNLCPREKQRQQLAYICVCPPLLPLISIIIPSAYENLFMILITSSISMTGKLKEP